MLLRNALLLLLVGFLPGPFALRAQEKPFDEPPIPVRTVAPVYPFDLKREGVSGMVSVSITIDVNGNVVDPTVTKSSRTEFERPAITAICKWKFKPAKKNGQPVAVKVSLPMKFAVEE